MKLTTARMENEEPLHESDNKIEPAGTYCNGSNSNSTTNIPSAAKHGSENGTANPPLLNQTPHTTDPKTGATTPATATASASAPPPNGKKNQSLRNRLPSFESQIHHGDFVDAQDSTGKWYEAVVTSLTPSTVRVHYSGWSSRWDCTLPRRRTFAPDGRPLIIPRCSKIAGPPQALWSHTMKWREGLGVGDEVEVREAVSSKDRPRWLRGLVRCVGEKDGAEVECAGGAVLEMFENEDGGDEVVRRPLLLLNRTQQVMIEVPEETLDFPSISPGIKTSTDTKATIATPADQAITAQPPFIRWVYLYGEEICERNTHIHIKSHLVDDLETAAASKTRNNGKKTPVTMPQQTNSSRYANDNNSSSSNTGHNGGLNRESRKGVPPAHGSVGFRNLGNSCYMNSTIQCLNRIEPLTDYFLKGKYSDDINENNPLGSGGRIAKSYAALLGDMWSGEYSILAPQELKGTLGNFAPQFNNLHQHDSQEFCSFLMDGIHEDLNRVKVKPYVGDVEGWGMDDHTAALESWQKHLLRHDSVIVDSCQGMHRSHLTCLTCRKESVKFDVYSNLSLSLEPSSSDDGRPISITDCLEQFTMGEQLDEQNAWYCPTCRKNVRALKMMKLWSTPDILILHLKRFTFDTCSKRGGLVRSKIESVVDFPIDTLDMEPYIQGPIDPAAPPSYALFAVSEHSGSTPNSGHYTSTVRDSSDGKWYRYDDSHVSVTSGDTAVTGGAYLLFYKRKTGVSRWAGLQNAMNNKVTAASLRKPVDAEGFTEVTMRRKKKKSLSPAEIVPDEQ